MEELLEQQELQDLEVDGNYYYCVCIEMELVPPISDCPFMAVG